VSQTRISASERIERAIDVVLSQGNGEDDQLSELGRLGAQLVIQRSIDEEVAAFLQRARYERRQAVRGSRNGHRPRRV
jgi:hypothetical protein